MRLFKYLVLVINLSFCVSIEGKSIENVKNELDQAIDLVRSNKYDSAQLAFESLMPKILSSNNDTLKAKAFTSLYSLQLHNELYDSALHLINCSIDLFTSLRDTVFLNYCYKERSLRHLILGNYDKAINDSQIGIELCKAIGDTLGWAKNLSCLSNINHDIYEFDLGIEYGHQALNLYEAYSEYEADDKAYAINCIAINHDDKGEHQKAIDYHMMVIAMMDKMSEKNHARTYNNIGNSLMKLERYEEAIGWLKKNLEINKRIGRKYGLATVKTNIGTLSYLNNQFNNSKLFLDEAEAISYEINDVEKIHDVLFQQYKLYQAWGKFEKSLKYLEKYHFFKDSLFNETRTKQLTEMQTKYETELKEKEIEKQQMMLAQKDVTLERNQVLTIGLIGIIALLVAISFLQRNRLILKQQKQLEQEKSRTKEAQIEAALDSQESERKRFARDLHDGFGQMISVLNLNLKSLEKGTSTKEEVFDSSSKVLQEMYRELKGICFNLMPETLIKNGVVDAIKEFSNRINQTGGIVINVDTFGITSRLSDLQEISIYRITQEWVNNILKYSNADKATISLTKDEEEITLLIEDNGAGFDKGKLITGAGNGWKNMNSRANLIKGELELETIKGVLGSTLIVNVPAIIERSSKPVNIEEEIEEV